MLVLFIAVGGVLGTLARFGLASWVHSWTGDSFPWGILAVNVSGSAGLGLCLRLLLESDAPPEIRAAVAIGFFGAFTTMSTFSYETIGLLQNGHWGRALAYVGATLALVFGGTILGWAAGAVLARGAG